MLLGSRHVAPGLQVWEADVLLVLVDVYYEPYAKLPRPVGPAALGRRAGLEPLWLSALDEAALPQSLPDADVIVLAELRD